MSTDEELVAAAIQQLPRMVLTECHACHARVYFRCRSSVASPDPRFKVVYLRCPACGASAVQLREVENLPRRKPKVRYSYQH